jgi:hypothetical protein
MATGVSHYCSSKDFGVSHHGSSHLRLSAEGFIACPVQSSSWAVGSSALAAPGPASGLSHSLALRTACGLRSRSRLTQGPFEYTLQTILQSTEVYTKQNPRKIEENMQDKDERRLGLACLSAMSAAAVPYFSVGGSKLSLAKGQ